MRRLAAMVLLLGVFATLALAAGHNHLDTDSRQGDGCIYCSGAIATTPAVPSVEPPPSLALDLPAQVQVSPARRYLLQLDHSGCAPPQA